MSETETLQNRIAELEAELKSMDKSAQMLVRRDLELRRANGRLQALDSAKSEFVSIAAHQMRTPLSAIKWSQQMLYDEELGPLTVEQKQMVSQTSKSATRLIRLVNNLLDADHLEVGRAQYDTTEVDLIVVLQEIITDLQSAAQEKKIDIKLLVDREIPLLHFNRERLKDIFFNLVDNAIKYTPATGTITIQATPVSGVTVMVSDTGIGVPEIHKEKLFSRFARAENAKRVDADGSGLGLYIVKKIIEANDGTITCDSTEGVGTRFTINLPNVVQK